MKNIINQIYWEQISNTYMAGTTLKKEENEKVFFKNLLMTSGKKIIDWSSRLNYQVFKEVPSLPILQNGKKYRIRLFLRVKPEGTAIFCLHFFDLQMSEINSIVFSTFEKTFTYPDKAVSYTFEILNGGCTEIEFDKLQLASADLPKNYFDNFLVLPLNKNKSASKVGLILLPDSKRTREIEAVKLTSEKEVQFYLIHISWQDRNQLSRFLNKWLIEHSIVAPFIFTDNSFLAQQISNLRQINEKIKLININTDTKKTDMQRKWFTSETVQVDQNRLIKKALDYFKE